MGAQRDQKAVSSRTKEVAVAGKSTAHLQCRSDMAGIHIPRAEVQYVPRAHYTTFLSLPTESAYFRHRCAVPEAIDNGLHRPEHIRGDLRLDRKALHRLFQ